MNFFFSKLAVFDGQKSIRGGIPIVFREYKICMRIINFIHMLQIMMFYNYFTLWFIQVGYYYFGL